jgi:hypothetical protein
MKLTFVILVSCLFVPPCFSQAPGNHKLRAGVYSGINLSYFPVAAYRSSPLPGWKAGLLISYDVSPRWRLSAQMGATFDRCRVNFPALPFSIKWKYLWADVTPLFSYLPVRGDNFHVALGTGISVRRSLGTSIGGSSYDVSNSDAIYHWTYFLPFQLNGVFNLANQSRLVVTAEFATQLRQMYLPGHFNYSTGVDRMHSWGLVASYSIPLRHRA